MTATSHVIGAESYLPISALIPVTGLPTRRRTVMMSSGTGNTCDLAASRPSVADFRLQPYGICPSGKNSPKNSFATSHAHPIDFPLDRLRPRDLLQNYRGPTRDAPDDATIFRPIHDPIRDVDMRPTRDDSSHQVRDMASLVSRLAFGVLLLKSNITPLATAVNNDSRSPANTDSHRRLLSPLHLPVASLPLPTVSFPVVPIGEPIRTGEGARLKHKHSVKLETYAGQGPSLEAFLAKFEEHARFYKWN